MNTTRFLFCLTLTMALLSTAPSLAAKITFEQWLEQYGAWDRLEQQYALQDEANDPQSLLKRAEVQLNLNAPQEALHILELTPTFADNATEGARLWLGGMAHRAQGDLSRAVLWYSKAIDLLPEKDASVRIKQEPNLKDIWADAWLKLHWATAGNHTMTKGAQLKILEQLLSTGRSVWGNRFLQVASPAPQSDSASPSGQATKSVTMEEAQGVAQALAMFSLGQTDESIATLGSVQNETIRLFWVSVLEFLQNGVLPADLSPYVDAGLLKAHSFWQGNLLASFMNSRDAWRLGDPASGPWAAFRDKLLAMPYEEAVVAIDNELRSLLISPSTSTLLNNFKFALALAQNDHVVARNVWDAVDTRNLPLSLKLSGVLFFDDNIAAAYAAAPVQEAATASLLATLASAAGNRNANETDAPFWLAADPKEYERLAEKQWPLDKLIKLAFWQREFEKKPNLSFAKRGAYLFEDTSFGNDCLLFLADEAVDGKKLQLGARYLNMIDRNSLTPTQKALWLDSKTHLELNAGRNADALKTYAQLEAEHDDISVMTRLRMALLFQQNRDFDSARKQLLTMWENRNAMTTTLQAETLFWLGEGEQAVRNSEKALDYYLQLAWQYPQENIWALTAMYRASLIYEKRGKYETAKRLLRTVVKRADRKEQREAAKARLDAIDRKMGVDQSKQRSVLVYPF